MWSAEILLLIGLAPGIHQKRARADVFGVGTFSCKNITADHFQAASQRNVQHRHLGLLFRSLQCGQQPLVGTPLEGRVVLKVVVAQPLRGPSRGTTNPASA